MAWIGLIVAGIVGLALALLGLPADLFGITEEAVSTVVQAAGLVLCICTALFLGMRDGAGLGYRQTAVWLSVLLAGASVFAFRGELLALGRQAVSATQVAQDQAPETSTQGPRLIAIRANQHGQFDVDTLVNGTHVSMLADTGATLVTLTSEDARRIGFPVTALTYDIPLRTANGITHGAKVNIDELEVGGILVQNVAAIVSKPGVLHRSLLGMTYFREIGSFQLSGDQLVLRE